MIDRRLMKDLCCKKRKTEGDAWQSGGQPAGEESDEVTAVGGGGGERKKHFSVIGDENPPKNKNHSVPRSAACDKQQKAARSAQSIFVTSQTAI